MHKKVLDKGKPDDIMPGVKNKKVKFCDFARSLFWNLVLKIASKIPIIGDPCLASMFSCVSQTKSN